MSRVAFTEPRVRSFECPPEKKEAFLRDADTPGLTLRVTAAGAKSYVYQTKLGGKFLRLVIGQPGAWSLGEARKEARRLRVLTDQGIDPRDIKRQQQQQREAEHHRRQIEAVTFGTVWQQYTAARWHRWGQHHRQDHARMTRPPGTTKAGKPAVAGALYCFWDMRLADLTPEAVQAWADTEAQHRPTVARLAWRLLRAFLAWCAEQPEYSDIHQNNPAQTKAAREALGSGNARSDVLEKGQLQAWFNAVQGINNPVIAAYIQAQLLTGARPNELRALKWKDINQRWQSVTLRDKDESKGGKDGMRTIPLTPYVWHLLAGLPRRNSWVFSSPTVAGAAIHPPQRSLSQANTIAGIKHVTFQGLRRSFGSLSEWLEIPAGVIAQLQGHKPSATAEKHYRVRPLDLLRVHAESFEAWILEQAGIDFDPQQEPGKLRLVAGKNT